MPPLERQVTSWSLTGGLASKDSPLSQVPGTHIDLKNVRQERSDEWRVRNGYTRDALDDLPGGAAPAMVAEIAGGAVGLSAETGFAPAGLEWVQSTTAARWARMQAPDCAQSTPSQWARRHMMNADAAPTAADYCEGSVYSLTAQATPGRGIVYTVAAKADAMQVSDPVGGVLLSSGIRPRCVLGPSDRLCLVYIDTVNASVLVNTWNGATGANLGAVSFGLGIVNPAATLLDALWYGGVTITVVYRTAAGALQFVEYNPVTLAIVTNVAIVNANLAVVLLPDPDASGTRLVAYSDTAPITALKRVTSAGAVLTTDTIFAGTTLAIAGVAYQAGASWMVVYAILTGGVPGGYNVCKKRSGVINTTTFVPAQLPYEINSGAWREPGTDLMRFMCAIHGVTSIYPGDPQDSFFEMAVAFDTGATVVNLFPEPQARLIPFNAGPTCADLPHAPRIDVGKFALALPRVARIGRAPTTIKNQYAVDVWQVTYHPAGGLIGVNRGPAASTGDAAYIPAGSLLQAASGRRIVSHGLATAPLMPVLTPAVGAGGLTTPASYQYLTVVEALDDDGNIWRGPPSAAAAVTLGGGQNQVTVAVKISAIELAGRIVTAKTYRTAGNGSLFRMVDSRTGTVSSLQAFSFLDQFSDAQLAFGEPLSGEAPATITPAFSHVAFWGGRAFGVSRDFPTQLWFTKVLRAPFQPEFPGDVGFIVTFDDEFGDITGIAPLDDKLVVMKRHARYIVQGDGPDATGAGAFATSRVGSDWGCVAGGTLVSTGTEVYSTTERGVWRMDNGLRDDYVGAGIDQWINQPGINVNQQAILGGVYVPAANEVRFISNNAISGEPKQFVYDRLRGIWYTDVGDGINGAAIVRQLGTRTALFLANGRMLFEAGPTTTTDDGAGITGVISSAWIRPAGNEGRLRLYRARLLGSQPTTGASSSPFLLIYRDNDNGLFELFQPLVPLLGSAAIIRAEARPRHRKCSSFRLLATLQPGSTLRLDKWAVEFGLKPGMQKLSSSQRWRSP